MAITNKYNFLIGFLSATILLTGIYFLIKPKKNNNNSYVILKSDYKIEGAGFIEKGTILKIDEGMSEGFTKENTIIPYWLNNP